MDNINNPDYSDSDEYEEDITDPDTIELFRSQPEVHGSESKDLEDLPGKQPEPKVLAIQTGKLNFYFH